jgi:regulation of enolase protein 1 (concanavalin A-like superfamily)
LYKYQTICCKIVPQRSTRSNPDGKTSVNKVPNVTVSVESDFELQAHVSANFGDAYDGAGLLLMVDDNNWAKLMFERFKSGINGVASTVNSNGGDDAYHLRTDTDDLYLKAVNKGDVFTFYYSFNGEDWLYTRSFTLNKNDTLKVGIFAQSPLTGNMSAIFEQTCVTH